MTNQFSCNCGRNFNSSCTCNIQPTCTCLTQVDTNCVFYRGNTTPCLQFQTGSTLSTILNSIDSAFCSINPSGTTNPSGVPTVTGTTNQIIINNTGTSPIINYQVGLSPVVTNNISTLQSQMSSVSNFLNSTITTLTTDTPQNLDISNVSANTWNINFTQNVSGQSGILYSDYSDSTTANTSWTTVKSFTIVSGTLALKGDKLIIQTRFNSPNPLPTFPPSCRIQFNGVTIQTTFPFWNNKLNIMDFEIWITRQSNTSIVILLKPLRNAVDNGTSYTLFGEDNLSYIIPMTGLNLTTNSYPINCDILSNISGDTTCKLLEVELKKFL